MHVDEDRRPDVDPDDDPDTIGDANRPFRPLSLTSRGCLHRCSCGTELRCGDADKCRVKEPYSCPTCLDIVDEQERDAWAEQYLREHPELN